MAHYNPCPCRSEQLGSAQGCLPLPRSAPCPVVCVLALCVCMVVCVCVGGVVCILPFEGMGAPADLLCAAHHWSQKGHKRPQKGPKKGHLISSLRIERTQGVDTDGLRCAALWLVMPTAAAACCCAVDVVVSAPTCWPSARRVTATPRAALSDSVASSDGLCAPHGHRLGRRVQSRWDLQNPTTTKTTTTTKLHASRTGQSLGVWTPVAVARSSCLRTKTAAGRIPMWFLPALVVASSFMQTALG